MAMAIFWDGWLAGPLDRYQLSPWLKRASSASPFHDISYRAAQSYSLTVGNSTQVRDWPTSTTTGSFCGCCDQVRSCEDASAKVPDGQEFESPVLPLRAA